MHSYYSRLEIPSAFSLPDHGSESISGRKAITREKIIHYPGSLMMPGLGMLVGFLSGLGAVSFRYLIGLFQTLIYGSGSDLATIVQGLPWDGDSIISSFSPASAHTDSDH